MLQRRHNTAGNGKDLPIRQTGPTPGSSSSLAGKAKRSDRCPNDVDRQTSVLNRRILPHNIDARTAPAKRLLGLVRDLLKKVDDPEDPITRSRLVGAALLIMKQETLAHDLAAGKEVSPDTVVRVTNATERALSRLK